MIFTGQGVRRWNASGVLELRTAPMVGLEHGFDLIVVAPIMWTGSGSGIALLGELAKIVTVSSARFGSSLTLHPNGTLGIALRGAPHEQVELAYVVYGHRGDMSGSCRRRSFVLGAEGLLGVTVG